MITLGRIPLFPITSNVLCARTEKQKKIRRSRVSITNEHHRNYEALRKTITIA